jgi:hypothetical protein
MNSAINQRLSEARERFSPYSERVEAERLASFHIKDNFFHGAEVLRAQFEKQMTDTLELNDGLTPFLFAFSENTYQFLTATAERVFSRDILEEFTRGLKDWGKQALRTSYASTPQLRLYLEGCRRALLRDSTEARWHYMFMLGRNTGKKAAQLSLVTQTTRPSPGDRSMSIDNLVRLQLQFDQLLVHAADNPYGVEAGRTSLNPLHGDVFIDGYLW